MKLKEAERRVQELEGRWDTTTIIIIIVVTITITITIITIITVVRLKDDQLMGRIREAEHSQQVLMMMKMRLMILMLIAMLAMMISKVAMTMMMISKVASLQQRIAELEVERTEAAARGQQSSSTS